MQPSRMILSGLLSEQTYYRKENICIWEAYKSVTELRRKTGLFISEHCGFKYPSETEQNMTEFIHCLKEQKQTDISRKE